MPKVILEVSRLSKSYGQLEVLKDISSAVNSGEVIGLVGLNGAGKTTLLETILGLNTIDQGEISVMGVPVEQLAQSPVKARIGFVSQQDELLLGLTGARYLELMASFYDTWDHSQVDRLQREWSVPVDRSISQLSVGQRQKLAIVSAMGHNPDLLILDEPVASLDPVARRQFLAELVAIAHDRSCTIIFSTHIVTDLERVADRLWLLKEGGLCIDEHLDELKDNNHQNLEDFFLEAHS